LGKVQCGISIDDAEDAGGKVQGDRAPRQKTMAVYGSAVGKKGIKIQGGAAGHSHSDSNYTHYPGRSFWMEGFAAFLSGQTFYDKTAGDL
jgi:ribosome modulation factor